MARTLRGLRKASAPTQNKSPGVEGKSPAQRQLARFQSEREVRRSPRRQETPSAQEQARLDEETAQQILADAPAWAQQARIDPYNDSVTHYIDLAGNATPPETERKGGFTLTGYPRGVPEAYMPEGALDPKPKPKPGSGPPTVADDLVNQVDLARLRIVKDLKRENPVQSVNSEGLSTGSGSTPSRIGPDESISMEGLSQSSEKTLTPKQKAEKTLQAKLDSREWGDEVPDVSHAGLRY